MRWKLMCPHYLNTVEPTEWEYNETSRKTGKLIRKRFPVPRYLNTLDPGDWTNKWGGKDDEDGEIVVCHQGKGQSGDIEFIGDPTPDMVPLDDEAKALSKTFEARWSYAATEDMPISYSQSLIDRFEAERAEMQTKAQEVPGMSDLIATLGKLAESIASQHSRRL